MQPADPPLDGTAVKRGIRITIRISDIRKPSMPSSVSPLTFLMAVAWSLNYSPVCFGIATVRCVTPVLSPRPGCESSVPSPSTINPLLLPRKGNISQNRTILLRVLLALGIKFPRKYCKTFGGFRKTSYLCSAFQKRALSSVGSERLPYKQRVGGSNPSAPTSTVRKVELYGLFFVSVISSSASIIDSNRPGMCPDVGRWRCLLPTFGRWTDVTQPGGRCRPSGCAVMSGILMLLPQRVLLSSSDGHCRMNFSAMTYLSASGGRQKA